MNDENDDLLRLFFPFIKIGVKITSKILTYENCNFISESTFFYIKCNLKWEKSNCWWCNIVLIWLLVLWILLLILLWLLILHRLLIINLWLRLLYNLWLLLDNLWLWLLNNWLLRNYNCLLWLLLYRFLFNYNLLLWLSYFLKFFRSTAK